MSDSYFPGPEQNPAERILSNRILIISFTSDPWLEYEATSSAACRTAALYVYIPCVMKEAVMTMHLSETLSQRSRTTWWRFWVSLHTQAGLDLDSEVISARLWIIIAKVAISDRGESKFCPCRNKWEGLKWTHETATADCLEFPRNLDNVAFQIK